MMSPEWCAWEKRLPKGEMGQFQAQGEEHMMGVIIDVLDGCYHWRTWKRLSLADMKAAIIGGHESCYHWRTWKLLSLADMKAAIIGGRIPSVGTWWTISLLCTNQFVVNASLILLELCFWHYCRQFFSGIWMLRAITIFSHKSAENGSNCH